MNTLLHEILAAREARVQHQQQLLRQYGATLVCFTMNIPGPAKDSPLIRRAFKVGLALLDEQLSNVLFRDVSYAATGREGYFVIDADAGSVKETCVKIEESCPLGRLFDMDVLDAAGNKLQRQTERSCMVCGKAGRFCAASRAHDVAILQETTKKIIVNHFSAMDAAHIAALAVQALIDEVHTTPKPGLVDEKNCGSHADMDIHLFEKSAKTLEAYFLKCAQIGQKTAKESPAGVFPLLRAAGIDAEKQMFAATCGINTHKGAIYTLGLLCAAVGRLWSPEQPFATADDILQTAGSFAAAAAADDFAAVTTPKTAGEKLYLELGLTGIRGEAAAGFPSIKNIALPVYRQQLATGKSQNDAAAVTLLYLIANVEDTNLYRRGGKKGAEFAKNTAATLLPAPTAAEIAELDRKFIAKNLSPGGCADLLAATLFLYSLSH